MTNYHEENKELISFFVRGEIREGESSDNAIAREIKQQINIPYEIIFICSKYRGRKVID